LWQYRREWWCLKFADGGGGIGGLKDAIAQPLPAFAVFSSPGQPHILESTSSTT